MNSSQVYIPYKTHETYLQRLIAIKIAAQDGYVVPAIDFFLHFGFCTFNIANESDHSIGGIG